MQQNKEAGWVKQYSKNRNKHINGYKSYTEKSDPRTNQPTSHERKNYADIVKPDTKNETNNKIINRKEYTPFYKFFNLPTKGKTVRNQIPKNKSSSLGVWEYVYFKHILNLKKIFVDGIKNFKFPAPNNIETISSYFFDNFSRFIKEYSSGEISPYIENLNEYEEEEYYKFTITKED